MRIIIIPLKNIFGNLGRSLTFGSFVFFAVIIVIFVNCFLMTVKSNMEDSLINTLAGHIQIRSAGSKEEDMFSHKLRWDDVDYLKDAEIKAIENFLNKSGLTDYTKRVRHNGIFISDTAKIPARIIGLDLRSKAYQTSFKLTHGRYLDSKNTHEILLSEEQAKQLKVKAGDTLGVLAQIKDGYTVDSALTVVGIGTVNLLSIFGFSPAYTDLKSAQELIGYSLEVSDIILYINNKDNADQIISKLSPIFQKAGLMEYIKLSTWKGMGGFVMGFIDFLKVIFNSFFVFLMFIVAILILNLVYMIGLERRQEVGTLRAIGFSQSKTGLFFICEILLITIFFCLLGFIIASGLVLILGEVGISAKPPMSYLIGEQFFIKFDIMQVVLTIAIIFGVTFFASLYPSYKATSLKPAEILKEM